jgi:MFS family permease
MSLSQDRPTARHASAGHEPHGRDDSLWSPGRRNLTGGLVLTITIVAFEALAVSTVMPVVADDLGGIELYGWVFTAFMLASLIGIVVAGALIDRRGLGLPYAAGLGLFAIGLLLGGLAPSMEVLVVARFIQGLGAGVVPPVAYVAIGRSLPERLRPRMFATLSTAWVLPGVMGPAIAGVVADLFDWRIVFLGLLPLLGLAVAISFRSVASIVAPEATAGGEATASASMRRRLPLAVAVALGTGLTLAGLTSGETAATIGLVVLGLLLGVPAFARLTPSGTLRAARGLPAAVLLRGIMTFAFFGVDAYIALALVDGRGLTAAQAGISLTAATITWTAGSWVQARYATRISPERFIGLGLPVVIVGLAAFTAVLHPAVTPWAAIPTIALAGFGMGLAYAPTTLIVLRRAAPVEQGSASAALSLADSLGTALGTGVTGAFVAAAVRAGDGAASGLLPGFAVAIGVAVVGLILSPRLGPGRVASPAVVAAEA